MTDRLDTKVFTEAATASAQMLTADSMYELWPKSGSKTESE